MHVLHSCNLLNICIVWLCSFLKTFFVLYFLSLQLFFFNFSDYIGFFFHVFSLMKSNFIVASHVIIPGLRLGLMVCLFKYFGG